MWNKDNRKYSMQKTFESRRNDAVKSQIRFNDDEDNDSPSPFRKFGSYSVGSKSKKKSFNVNDEGQNKEHKCLPSKNKRKSFNVNDNDQNGEYKYVPTEQFRHSNAEFLPSPQKFGKVAKHVTFQDENDDASDSEGSGSDSDSEPEEMKDQTSESESSDSGEDNNLSGMTMADLLSLQEEMGERAFREQVLKVEAPKTKHLGSQSTCKRLNKNRPSEMPLMRKRAPVMKFLEPAKKVKEKLFRDPRFDDISGDLRMDLWNKNFDFLKETRQKEIDILKTALPKAKDSTEKQRMKLTMQRMVNQQQESVRRERENTVKRLEKAQQREDLRQGKKPRIMNTKEKKLLLKKMHFEDLKKKNKVGKYLEKKEKSQAKKEKSTVQQRQQ